MVVFNTFIDYTQWISNTIFSITNITKIKKKYDIQVLIMYVVFPPYLFRIIIVSRSILFLVETKISS